MRKGMTWIWSASMAVSLLSVTLAAEGVQWGYSGAVGPDKWSALDPSFALCAAGRNQSPIDLTGMIEAELERATFTYIPGTKEILHNGHTVQVNYAPGSSLTVSRRSFELAQFHFHAPSENRIEGESFPLEAQLVHRDADGNLAVIAVLFREGVPNAVLAKLWKSFPDREGIRQPLGTPLDASGLLPAKRDYFRFNGSLTTPPCSEGVIWLVMKDRMTASKEQIARLTTALEFANNRPVQPLNARAVLQ